MHLLPSPHSQLHDGLTFDGLTDVYNNFHMGNCGENTARKLGISREEQDDYGLESYRRAAAAYDENRVQPELFDVEVATKKKTVTVTEDDEFRKIKPDKFKKLPTAFQVREKEAAKEREEVMYLSNYFRRMAAR